jgi:regulatory protein
LADPADATTDAASRAYRDGLRMLARRELSTAQLRRRLLVRRHDPEHVESALQRLRAERALDERRTAAAIARTALGLQRHGPRRARQTLRDAGIDSSIADDAVADAYATVDPVAAIEALIDRRLAARGGVVDDAAAARVYRYLVSRGHDADLVTRALRRRQRGRATRDQ